MTTADGYILNVFRLPMSENAEEGANGRPVLCMHGIPSNANSMMVNGEDGSIASFLANKGYDVWLINFRGTIDSRNHETLDPDEDEFWQFTLADQAEDVRATVEFILQNSEFDTLSLVGLSHGSTIGLISLATYSDYFNPLVDVFVAYVPVTKLREVTSRFFSLITEPGLLAFLEALGVTELFNIPEDQSQYMESACQVMPNFCGEALNMFNGYDSETDNFESFYRLTSTAASGASLNVFKHYSQFRTKDSFTYYDYGSEENLEIYGTEEAPEIPLENIEVPVAIFASDVDVTASPSSIKWLASQLPNLAGISIDSDSNERESSPFWYPIHHISFLIARDTSFLDDMLKVIQEYV